MIRNYYCSNFESLVKCSIIFWGADSESIPIFKLQNRVVQSLSGVGTGTSCRQLFKDCKILTANSLYVFEVLNFLKMCKYTIQKK